MILNNSSIEKYHKLENESNATLLQASFSNLPLELYLKIFESLTTKTLLNLRSVNQHFRQLIDSLDTLWQLVYLKLDLDEKSTTSTFNSKLALLEQILEKNINIDLIEIKCAHVLTQNEKMEFKKRLNLNIGLTSSNRLFSIRISLLNTQSIIECLNLVSKNCEKLTIESFYEPNGQSPRNDEINRENELKFEYLTSLDLNCVISKRIDASNYYQLQNDFIKQFLLNQLHTVFPNLTRLHLRLYIYSSYFLYQKLSNLSELKFVEFHNCWMNGSNDSNVELDRLEREIIKVDAHKRLKIEAYLFRSTKFACIRMYLEHFSDLNHLVSLSLFNLSLASHELEYMLYLAINRLVGLKNLATDAFQTYVLNDFFDPRFYHLAKLLFSKLEAITLCDCCSFYESLTDGFDEVKFNKRRGRYLANYNYRFDLNDFVRLFRANQTTNDESKCVGYTTSRIKVKKIYITFVEDCCSCDRMKVQKIVRELLDYFQTNSPELKSLEVKFKCESFVFNNCNLDTCKFNKNLFKYLNEFGGLKNLKFFIEKNLIKIKF